MPNPGTKTEVSHGECSAYDRFQRGQAYYLGFPVEAIKQFAANHQTETFPVGYLGFRARIFPFCCTFLAQTKYSASRHPIKNEVRHPTEQ